MEKLQAAFRGRHARKVQVKAYEEGGKIACPFLSSGVIIRSLLDLLEAEDLIHHGSVFHDVGCGNGDIMVAVSKHFRVHTYGMDIDPLLIQTAQRQAREQGVDDLVHAQVGDVINVDLSSPPANVIYLFLIPHCLVHVSKIILRSCPEGTTVIAYKYKLPEDDGWKPIKTVETVDVLKPNEKDFIYLYRI